MKEPKVGEWWMCQSTDTLRTCPMVRVKDGWGSIQNAEGKALPAFVQTRPILEPLYKMVRQEPVVMRLENWSVVGNSDPYAAPELASNYLSGNVYGHPSFTDGDPVTTPPIVSVTDGVVHTASGSEYRLGDIDPDYELAYPNARLELLGT